MQSLVFMGDELKSIQFKDTVHQVCISHTQNKIDNNLAERTIPEADHSTQQFTALWQRCRYQDGCDLS